METKHEDLIKTVISFLKESILSRMDKSIKIVDILSEGPEILEFFKKLRSSIEEKVINQGGEMILSYSLDKFGPTEDLRSLLIESGLHNFKPIPGIDSLYITKNSVKYFDQGSDLVNKILFSTKGEDKLSICGRKVVRKSNYFGPIYDEDINSFITGLKERENYYILDL